MPTDAELKIKFYLEPVSDERRQELRQLVSGPAVREINKTWGCPEAPRFMSTHHPSSGLPLRVVVNKKYITMSIEEETEESMVIWFDPNYEVKL